MSSEPDPSKNAASREINYFGSFLEEDATLYTGGEKAAVFTPGFEMSLANSSDDNDSKCSSLMNACRQKKL